MSLQEIEALRALIREIEGGEMSPRETSSSAVELRAYLDAHRTTIGDFIASVCSPYSPTTT